MSDTSQGPGWWQAPDAKWYPPLSDPRAQGESSTCPAGHTVAAGSAFCPTCGAPIESPLAGKAQSGNPGGNDAPSGSASGLSGGADAAAESPRKPPLFGTRRSKRIIAIAAVVVILGASAGVAIALSGSGSGSSPSSPLTPAEAAYARCDRTVSQGVAELASINVNNEGALSNAMTDMALRFGAQNPEFDIITTAWGLLTRTEYQNGESQGIAASKVYIAQQCVQLTHLTVPTTTTAPTATATTLPPILSTTGGIKGIESAVSDLR